MAAQSIHEEDLAWLCQMLREETAIVVDRHKAYLVEARLLPLARARGISLPDLIRLARNDRTRTGERRKVIEAMTTNETSFFRDPGIFQSITGELLTSVLEARPGEAIRIWCAACATGQEPYSLAMALCGRPSADADRVEILATDIDTQALERARRGEYSRVELNRGLPVSMQHHFEQHGDHYRVRQRLREMVEFREINLAKAWPTLPIFDLILIRNVLIYFEQHTKAEVLSRALKLLHPSGLLVLGSTESVRGCGVPLETVAFGRCTAYRVGE